MDIVVIPMHYKDIYSFERSPEPDVETLLAILITPEVDSLPDDGPFSVGVHPRDVTEDSEEDLLFARELAHEDSVFAIGACGVDRTVRVAWSDQLQAFEDQISVSEILCKPLIVHCVRAHSDVITLRRDLHPIQPWVLHGFNKDPDTIERVVEAGLYVSFGAAILDEDSGASAAIKHVPAGQLFLETGPQRDANIKSIYAQAAKLRGVTEEELAQQIAQNFESVFRA